MTTTQMQAAQFRSFGGPEVLEVVTVPRPAAGPGEVLVRVEASAVNQHDTFLRDGTLKMMTGRKFPMGLGLDFAGVVAEAGPPAGDIAVGTRVWGMVSPKAGHVTGSAAQYVVVPADRVAAFPEHLTMVEAASLVTSAESAVHAVRDVAQAKAGGRLLVRGAAGGVGMTVVQLAHALGTHVTALASARDAGFVTGCGADQVLDYRTAGPRDIGPFDVIIDTSGHDLLAFRRRLNRHRPDGHPQLRLRPGDGLHSRVHRVRCPAHPHVPRLSRPPAAHRHRPVRRVRSTAARHRHRVPTRPHRRRAPSAQPPPASRQTRAQHDQLSRSLDP